MTPLLIALGGALGAVLRFVVDAEIKAGLSRRATSRWASLPIATFCINIVGSGVLGAVSAAHPSAATAAFVTTGICGGFTTFSTASVETLTLLRSRGPALAMSYAALTLISCCLACSAGAALL